MAVKLRLTRVGKTKQPQYRIVAADSRSPRDGRFIEIVGHYNPLTDPSSLTVDNDKAVKWLLQGAQPQLINGSRRTRIANGSGTTPSDVNRLVKQFSEMQKMMKRFGGLGTKRKGKRGGFPGMPPGGGFPDLAELTGGPGGFPGLPQR